MLLAVALVVRGIGLGAILMAVLAGAYIGLAKADIPHASTTTRIAQQVGGSFGTAILAVVLQRGLAAHPTAQATAFDHAFTWALVLSLPDSRPSRMAPRRRKPTPSPRSADLPPGRQAHRAPGAPRARSAYLDVRKSCQAARRR